MNQEVNKQLIGGGDLTKSIIDGRLPKQQKQTRKKLENNAKVKKTKISTEQGFRNYMKYTDPLLLTNNEDLDKSELNDNISQLLEIFNPQQINNDKMREVENFVSKEEPVDVNDYANEIGVKITSFFKKKPTTENTASPPILEQPVIKYDNATLQQARDILKNIPKSENVKKVEDDIYKSKNKHILEQAALDGKDRINEVSAISLQAHIKRKLAQEKNKPIVPQPKNTIVPQPKNIIVPQQKNTIVPKQKNTNVKPYKSSIEKTKSLLKNIPKSTEVQKLADDLYKSKNKKVFKEAAAKALKKAVDKEIAVEKENASQILEAVIRRTIQRKPIINKDGKTFDKRFRGNNSKGIKVNVRKSPVKTRSKK